MIPRVIKTGGSNDIDDHHGVLTQAVTLSAFHELAKQVVFDCSVLAVHHFTAELYYYMDMHNVSEDEVGTLDELISKEEQDEIKKELMHVVMEFHILNKNGMVARFTPLVNYITHKTPISNNDPLLQEIVTNSSKYNNSILLGEPKSKIIEQMMSFPEPDTKDILNTIDSEIKVGVFVDDQIQCMCDYCKLFFDGLADTETVEYNDLNSLQQILAQHYFE